MNSGLTRTLTVSQTRKRPAILLQEASAILNGLSGPGTASTNLFSVHYFGVGSAHYSYVELFNMRFGWGDGDRKRPRSVPTSAMEYGPFA